VDHLVQRLHKQMSLSDALKWSFLAELASKAVSPVVFLVLARLLTPEDFGVMSAALMVMGFSQIFWEAGMSKALIQRQTDTQEAANVAFWVNIGLSIVIASLLFIAAGTLARTFFNDERVTAIIQVMTLQVVLGALSSVHSALLQKDMGFKKLFWVRFATVSLPGLASIPLALGGMGYWALAAGTIVGQVIQVIMFWSISRWRPQLSFDTKVAKEMVSFGAWVGATGMLAWFYIWADSLIVGMYLGSHELGLYRTGNQFPLMIFEIFFGPFIIVLYSRLARMGENKHMLREAALKVIKTLIFISIPLSVIIYSLANQLSDALFGEKWQGISLVIGVMALTHGFSWIVGMNGEFYRAMGKPSFESIVTAATFVIYFTAYLISIRYGFEYFIWTRLGLAIFALFLHLFLINKILLVPLRPIISYMLLICSLSCATVFVVHYILNLVIVSSLMQLIIGGVMNFLILGIILFIIEKNGLLIDFKLITNKIAK
jgi:O-antigen/teichoic acid export membrane protein